MAGLESPVTACCGGVARCCLTLEVTLRCPPHSLPCRNGLISFFSPHFLHFSSHYICNTFINRAYFLVEFKTVYSV